jgi:lipopolysaccharide transport system ATP-binding protein
MFARLGFSVAAHIEPDVLIVDEVLSVGDYVFQQKGLDKMRSVLQSGATVIFVSHNLRAVADLCDRALLLSKGRIIEDGPASAVVHHYMDRVRSARTEAPDREVVIESVTVYGSDGTRSDFESGETVRVEVKVKALQRVSRVACLLWMLDDKFYEIFNTSSEGLGQPPRELAEGDRHTFSFELDLHLARGNFHLCAGLHRYDIEKRFDQLQPAATLLIRSSSDVRGVVNLYARLVDSRAVKSA